MIQIKKKARSKTSATKTITTKKVKVKKIKDDSTTTAEAIIYGIQEKKGEGITSLDLRKIKSAVTDYFIVCHANSRTHVEAIARSVEDEVYKKLKISPWHKEGFENAEWILLDYITVVVHIFQKEKRLFYGIEKLWADAKISKIA